MTIHSNKGTRIIKFECDSCSEILDTEVSNFDRAREIQDDAGWSYRKIDGVGVHHCGDCGPVPQP